MAFEITFLGGDEAGNIGSNEWRNTGTGDAINFAVGKPIVIDPEKATNPQQRDFFLHVINKARGNKFYKVEEKRGPGRPRKDEGGDE